MSSRPHGERTPPQSTFILLLRSKSIARHARQRRNILRAVCCCCECLCVCVVLVLGLARAHARALFGCVHAIILHSGMKLRVYIDLYMCRTHALISFGVLVCRFCPQTYACGEGSTHATACHKRYTTPSGECACGIKILVAAVAARLYEGTFGGCANMPHDAKACIVRFSFGAPMSSNK